MKWNLDRRRADHDRKAERYAGHINGAGHF